LIDGKTPHLKHWNGPPQWDSEKKSLDLFEHLLKQQDPELIARLEEKCLVMTQIEQVRNIKRQSKT
jgi:hypothetical protein